MAMHKEHTKDFAGSWPPCRTMTLILERPEILLAEQHGPSWHSSCSIQFSAEIVFE